MFRTPRFGTSEFRTRFPLHFGPPGFRTPWVQKWVHCPGQDPKCPGPLDLHLDTRLSLLLVPDVSARVRTTFPF